LYYLFIIIYSKFLNIYTDQTDVWLTTNRKNCTSITGKLFIILPLQLKYLFLQELELILISTL